MQEKVTHQIASYTSIPTIVARLAAITAFLYLSGCQVDSIDEDESDAPTMFLDQDVSGALFGQVFQPQDGSARTEKQNGADSSLIMTMVEACSAEKCELNDLPNKRAIIKVPLKRGTYVPDVEGETTLRYLLLSETGNQSFTEINGQIEIITLSPDSVIGRIAAGSSRKTFLNGNFRLVRCKP